MVNTYNTLVDYDCVVLDGECKCARNPNGGVPPDCKYLKNEEVKEEESKEPV